MSFFAHLLEIRSTAGRCDIYAMVCGGTVSMIIFCDAGVGYNFKTLDYYKK